jgi:RNA polymerase sigma factor (sigma-70 family)
MAAVPSIGRASRVEHPLGQASRAAQALYERHYRRILGFCQYQLGSRHEAEDAAQTTFMHALGALQRGVVPVREVPWLLTIARNVCRTRWDAGRRRGRIEFNGDPHVIEETAAADGEPEWTLLGLEEALAALPEQQRLAILLREWQGLSYHEIAEVLGVSVSAVETSIFRARRGLAKKLGDENGRRGALDLGSLLTAFKSALFGGSGVAVKLAATAAVVVAGTGAAVTTVTLRHDPPPVPTVSNAVSLSETAVPLPPALSRLTRAPVAHRPARVAAPPRVAAPVARPSRPKPRSAAPRPGAPAAATPAAPTSGAAPAATPPVSTPAPAAARPTTSAAVQHAKPATQPPAKTTKPVQDAVESVTKPVNDVTQPVVQTVVGVAKPVLDTVNTVVPPVVQTVASTTQPVVNAVTNVTQPVVTTVTTVVAPVLPPPPAEPPAPASPPATGALPPLPQLPVVSQLPPLLPTHP